MRLTRRLFLFCLGLSALVAVSSYWWQLPGLASREGIAPIGPEVEAMRAAGVGFWAAPSLLWLSSSDAMLHALCGVALLCGLLLVLGLAPRLACLGLWASWLSLVQLGQPFLAFQWDVLLVEAAFCGALFAPPGLRPRLATEREPLPALRAVLLVLACKVTLESGIVKLTSGDPSWEDLTALTYHWWSQPLPTWSSVLLAQLPPGAQRALCGAVLALELLFPLLAFGPRPARLLSAAGLMLLQLALFAGGNYSFYSVLTFTLAVPLLDDALLRRLWSRAPVLPEAPARRPPWTWAVPALYLALGAAMFLGRRVEVPGVELARRFHTVNAYGAFAVMTKHRAEILVEGSADGVTWRAYEFPWKPGDLHRRPTFVAPWQPRLDWQMWFAALGSCGGNPWLLELQRRLLLGTPQVLRLFETNPFEGAPPRYLRTRSFEYRFAKWGEPGTWWTREELGPYCPPVSLAPDGRLQRAF